jgi:hypothetical protein
MVEEFCEYGMLAKNRVSDNVGGVKQFSSTPRMHSEKSAISLSMKIAVFNQGSLAIVLCGGNAYSKLLPIGQRHQFVQDFLQSLQPTLMIPR